MGALTGLGGGVVLVPMLTLLFGVDLKLALGASLVSVIATSSGAAAAYVREGFTNLRLGMLLEVATTSGALVGATLTALLPHRVVRASLAWCFSTLPTWAYGIGSGRTGPTPVPRTLWRYAFAFRGPTLAQGDLSPMRCAGSFRASS